MTSLLPSTYYHIYNHANGYENIFREEENYRFFLEKYNLHIHPIAETLAYCLMPNHFHLLIKVRDEETLLRTAFPKFKTLEKLLSANYVSKQFSNLFSSYTQSFNKKYERMGSLFIKNFKRRQVITDSYFSTIIRYIHFNPVHHRFARHIADWRWSSYHAIISSGKTILNRNEVLSWFGGREAFIRFHQQPVQTGGKDMLDDYDY